MERELSTDNLIIGKIKFIMGRQKEYVGWAQLIINIVILAILKGGLHLQWYYLLFIPIYGLWIWFDLKFIYPSERTFCDTQSMLLVEMDKKIDKILSANYSLFTLDCESGKIKIATSNDLEK